MLRSGCVFFFLIGGLLFSGSAFARLINLYTAVEVKSGHAKGPVVAKIQSDQTLIPIFYAGQGKWVKVALPNSGTVGWMDMTQFDGPMVFTQVKPGGQWEQTVVSRHKKGPLFSYRFSHRDGRHQPMSDQAKAQLHARLKAQQRHFEDAMVRFADAVLAEFSHFDLGFFPANEDAEAAEASPPISQRRQTTGASHAVPSGQTGWWPALKAKFFDAAGDQSE